MRHLFVGRRPFILLCSLGLVATLPQARAEAPVLESLYPAGGQQGTRVEVKVAGKGLEKNAPLAWCSEPGVSWKPVGKAGLWEVIISPESKLGPCLVRFFNDEGASAPRIFEVGHFEERMEVEPNDRWQDVKASASAPLLNATLNGVLAKDGDVDTWAIPVRQGKPLRLELHGYGLGSPMDPAMRLLDSRGVELQSSHDTYNLDPCILHTPNTDGSIYVQVYAFVHPPAAEVALKGSAHHVYRLHITEAVSAAVLAKPNPPATPLQVPGTVSGIVATPGQEAAYELVAKKGDDLQFLVRAKALHSPLDAVLRLENAEGKLLLQNDDSKAIAPESSPTVLDRVLRWKVPADGSYRVMISDRFHNGSAEHAYELTVRTWLPSFTLLLAEHAARVVPGSSATLKISAKIDGPLSEKFQVRAAALPPGVTAEPVPLPAKDGELQLTLKATAEASPSQAPFSVEVVPVSTEGAAEPKAVASYLIPFKEPRGDLQITTDSHPWLTVAPAKTQAP